MQNGEDLINFLSQELETKEVLRRFPYSLDLRAPMAVAVAILVAQERWTDADDQKYSAGFKKLIFEWAKDLSKLVPDSVADFQALEALRKQGLKAVVDVYKHQFLNRRVRSK